MLLNITYNGVSADIEVPLESTATDQNIKTIAAEILRSGDIENMRHPNVTAADFEHFTVHRSRTPQDRERVLLCPKAAYGAGPEVTCPWCGGRGHVIPKFWHSVVPPKPKKCKTCGGKGTVIVED